MEYFLEKHPKLAIALFFIIIFVFFGLCLFQIFFSKEDVPIVEELSSEVIEEVTEEEKDDNETSFSEFVEIEYLDHTEIWYASYADLTFMQTIALSEIEALEIELSIDAAGMTEKTSTGHAIYDSNLGLQYVRSGFDLLVLNEGVIQIATYLREETTGKRIYTFIDEDYLAEFENGWEEGQSILTGEIAAEEGTIIIDGVKIDSQFVREGDVVYANILDLMQFVLPSTSYDEDSNVLRFFLNEYESITIPSDDVDYGAASAYGIYNDTFAFTSEDGTGTTVMVHTVDPDNFLMDIREISLLLGWQISMNDTAISIVTDELNVTGDGCIYIMAGQNAKTSVIEQNDDGTKTVRVYDIYGKLLSEIPYDDTYVAPEVTEDTEDEVSTADVQENIEEEEELLL